jgi:hypothetical protein
MSFFYKAYNISLVSSLALPALVEIEKLELDDQEPIFLTMGEVPEKLKNSPNATRPFCSLNENEYLLRFPNIGNYYVTDGNSIVIEPIAENLQEVLVHFYASCLSAVLLQRNILTFHVSGVIVNNKVVLLAADSGTGKSTTSVKLQELGFPIFTDDTAVLKVENGICYATASYPMTRLWQETIDQQSIYQEANKAVIFAKKNKYSFIFHEQFITEKMPVAKILFLEKKGNEIQLTAMSPADCVGYLAKNIYVRNSIIGMKKQRLQFAETSAIAKVVPSYLAQRPSEISTLDTFAARIVEHLF